MKNYPAAVLLILIVQIISFAQTEGSCPAISVTAPVAAVYPGENLVFDARFPKGFDSEGLTYKWSVDRGTIVEGQGLSKITANTAGLSDVTITAKLEIFGMSKNCNSTFESSGIVKTIVPIRDPDDFGDLPVHAIFARLDAFAVGFTVNPHSFGFVVNYGTEELIRERESLMVYYLKTERKLDLSRIFFVRGRYEPKIRTRFWMVPKGEFNRECEDCGLVNGNDIKFDAIAIERELTKQSCPTISVSEPAVAVPPGENLTFTASVSDSDIRENIGYKWTISSGTIVKGQGTPTVTVLSDHRADTTLIATVEITGLPDFCVDNTASGSSFTICTPSPILRDEFELISDSEIWDRLDAFSKDLIADPNATGYIVSYGKPAETKNRERIISESLIDSAKIASSRIVFVNGGEEKTARTRLWIVPVGADSAFVD